MPRPNFSQAMRDRVYEKTGGKCAHCNVSLQAGWHVDHHPIPFRDIESNACCCAVRDPLEISNLQPSCPPCNTSHRFEPENRALYCGRTQCHLHERTLLHIKWAVACGASAVLGYASHVVVEML